jgi:DNA-binding XRE family transcriptional regulator
MGAPYRLRYLSPVALSNASRDPRSVRDKRATQAAIGRALRHYREQAGVSQEALGHACHVHRTFVGAIERGEQNPSLVTILKLVDALEVSLTEFAARVEQELDAK